MIRSVTAILLLTGVAVADAAPILPPSELPGRERYRFRESPLDRFLQPGVPQEAKPLWLWQCKAAKAKRHKHRRDISRRC